MSRDLLTGNTAAAWGARLADVDYCPVFPITPQTEIIETLGHWVDRGEMDAKITMMESEHSMITAAGAGALAGARVFTATSSQGLLHGIEMLYNVSGWRAPLVMVNVSRGLAAPITLEPDHNDIMAARDSGFLQLHCATCQEVVDSVLIAYRLGEDPRVRLPVIVNLDGFYLSFTREPVDLPDAEPAKAYVGAFDPGEHGFRADRPLSEAVAVVGGPAYSYFRYELHRAAEQAITVYDEAAAAFETAFGRSHPAVATYRMDDAEIAFVMIGAFATKAHDAIDQMRAAGVKAGLVRPRLLRPFPALALANLLAGVAGIAVVDQNISMGKGGVLHAEIASVLYGRKDPPKLLGFIGGLGGRDIGAGEFAEMARQVQEAVRTGEVPPIRLLYTATELREMRKLQAVAAVERHQVREEADQ